MIEQVDNELPIESLAPWTCIKCRHSGWLDPHGLCHQVIGREEMDLRACGCHCVFPAKAEAKPRPTDTDQPVGADRALIRRWRDEANEKMLQIRRVNYLDHGHRVQLYMQAVTLHRCANALYRLQRNGHSK